MALPSPKELLKLAAACRKAGIKSFKGDGVEFTLTDDAPVTKKAAKIAETTAPDKDFTSDELGPDAMLFWSTADLNQTKQEAS
jgi:hypothetical protein